MTRFTSIVLFLSLSPAALAAHIDWAAVPAQAVRLFVPGSASFEWVIDRRLHSGALNFLRGKRCTECHGEEIDKLAGGVATRGLEPAPAAGRPSAVGIEVRAAYDGERLHLRIEGPASAWSNPAPADAGHEYKISVLWDDGRAPGFAVGGCWMVCHVDLPSMPEAVDDYSSVYLLESRERAADGRVVRRRETDIAKMLANGLFLELWQVRFDRNPKKATVTLGGWVLDQRHPHPNSQLQGEVRWTGDRWSATLSRPMPALWAGQKALRPGGHYTLGFALHDASTTRRFHYVSLEHTLVIGDGEADLRAVRVP